MSIINNLVSPKKNRGNEMETSNNDNEPQQSFRSPPRRRRSTFFERRDSLIPQPFTDNIESKTCKQTNEAQEKYNQDLIKYHEKLLAEKEQWKNEVNNRRNKYHDLRQQYQLATKTPGRSRMSYAALSNEDIEFLKAKVNLSKLVESQLKLHKSVKETLALHRRAVELDNVILRHCEDKLNKVTEYILENSTID